MSFRGVWGVPVQLIRKRELSIARSMHFYERILLYDRRSVAGSRRKCEGVSNGEVRWVERRYERRSPRTVPDRAGDQARRTKAESHGLRRGFVSGRVDERVSDASQSERALLLPRSGGPGREPEAPGSATCQQAFQPALTDVLTFMTISFR